MADTCTYHDSGADPVDPNLASMLLSCTVCRSWAEQDEGPYHRDDQAARRDVVEDRDGVALQLGIRLARENGSPVIGAAVEVWQCDALGHYSGFPPPDDSAVFTAATAPRAEYLSDATFLRGTQHTDAAGMVEFRTIYPGWYPGRTVHIHVIVAADDRVRASQLYFPEAVNDDVLARRPYADRRGRDTTNATDTILPTGGDAAVVDLHPVGDGYRAAVCLLMPSARVSGPITTADAAPVADGIDHPGVNCVEVTESRESLVGAFRVRRALPRRGRRTVGAWCFVDHMGPATIDETRGLDVAPHPHIGLQTVTWLLEGEALHRDSLGTEQVLAPGQLNLMTARHGVSHSEEGTGRYRGELQGVQLWVAQPSDPRDGASAFEHHGELPRVSLGRGWLQPPPSLKETQLTNVDGIYT